MSDLKFLGLAGLVALVALMFVYDNERPRYGDNRDNLASEQDLADFCQEPEPKAWEKPARVIQIVGLESMRLAMVGDEQTGDLALVQIPADVQVGDEITVTEYYFPTRVWPNTHQPHFAAKWYFVGKAAASR